MSREIKFRAWDTFDNRMRDWANLKRMAYAASGGVEYVFNSEHFRVMQYTGLKDRNGKEIYEGDIFKHETQSPFYKDKPIDVEIGVVEWGVWSYMYGRKYGNPQLAFDRMKAIRVEVIGNIYENPELLNTN